MACLAVARLLVVVAMMVVVVVMVEAVDVVWEGDVEMCAVPFKMRTI